MPEQPDEDLIERIAAELGVATAFVEKDWHATRVVGVIAHVAHNTFKPVFAGGTSLSKAHGLIKRFSEDIDFKVRFSAKVTRSDLRDYRNEIVDRIRRADSDWSIKTENIISRNQSHFFSCLIDYPKQFEDAQALRPQIQLEMTFGAPLLSPAEMSVSSFVTQGRRGPPEAPAMACVSPVETAAEKLSALSWRVPSRQRGAERDDPTLVRHVHDLAALEHLVIHDQDFPSVLRELIARDASRGAAEEKNATANERLNRALNLLAEDRQYAEDYEKFVLAMSYADPGETPPFDEAIEAVRRLGKLLV